ncbi:hypothetical protein [Flavobacterium sp. CAU 1735]|uniref:hypothetical protein n=1 Tax=Flavobacterium sp. CAU 1735 TaxID=3140361 RepID=UPI0032610F1C
MNLKIFYLLGFINNYSGGFSTKDGIFQRFSFTEDFEISDHKMAVFKKVVTLCEQLLLETAMENDIRIDYFENQKGSILYSRNIVQLLDNAVKSKSFFIDRDYFLLNEDLFEKFERWDQNSYSYQQRIQFLNGVYDSNFSVATFYFYNDYKKCLLTHYVLRCFADEEDQITMQSYFLTPQTTTLQVSKNGVIASLIRKFSKP